MAVGPGTLDTSGQGVSSDKHGIDQMHGCLVFIQTQASSINTQTSARLATSVPLLDSDLQDNSQGSAQQQQQCGAAVS